MSIFQETTDIQLGVYRAGRENLRLLVATVSLRLFCADMIIYLAG
jgi:hypothetical protein